MKFEIGPGADCNLDALIETRMLVQCNSGGGKSWTLRRFLEQTFGKVQQLIIDPEGEFSSLRERFDYVLAAPHGGDTVADPGFAKLLATRLLELNASAILDIYELKAHDRVLFVRRFLEALVDAPKALWHPALIVIDEAHVYAPQHGDAESAQAVIDLATRGRKRGFCAVLATQRLSKLHKDTAAECNNKLIGRTGLDIDRKRAADELGFTGRDETLALQKMRPGEFYCYGPAFSLDQPQRVHVGPVETTHPKTGGRIAPVVPPPSEKIRRLLPQLADLPAEAEQERKSVDDLKRDNATLRRELTVAKGATTAALPSEELIARRVAAATTQQQREQAAALRVASGYTDRLERAIKTTADSLSATAERLRVSLNGHGIIQPRDSQLGGEGGERPSSPTRPIPALHPVVPSEGDGITRPQQRILDALAWWEAIGVDAPSKGSVGFIAGYRVGKQVGGTFGNLLGVLRSQGLLDYPKPGTTGLTDAGRAMAEPPPDMPTREALHRAVYDKLGGAEERVLNVLVEHYPESLTKQDAGEEAGYQVGPQVGGTFGNILGRLRSLGLIDYPTGGRVVATELLFPEGLA